MRSLLAFHRSANFPTPHFISVVLLLSLTTRWGLSAEPSTSTIEYFEQKVRPLLIDQCLDCHTGEDPESGLSMDSLSGLLRGGLRGPAIIVGKPEQSLLVQAMRHGEILKMPPKEKLSNARIAEVATWIKMGAAWPDSGQTSDPAIPTPDEGFQFTDAQRSFWSFQPPVRPSAPSTQRSQWIQSPIDAFILNQLETAGFSPAPPADRRALIRRATLDSLGLPPTPEEVDAFLSDESPHAMERLVDRLLSRPRYGERWGRHWLDVARYADSNGLDENLAFANAFHFRDYVIAAFNKDKPFDLFAQEQIAGDLLAESAAWDAPYEGKTATGFLALGAKMLAEDDPVKMQMDIIDEQVDTLGRAFLGMTFGCARCHDHKFDPIPTADYYALAGIFKSTKTMENFNVVARWQELPLATEEAVAVRAQHDALIRTKRKAIETVVKRSTDTVLSEARAHVGDYLLAALGLQRRKDFLAQTPVNGNRPSLPNIPGALLIEAEDFDRGNVLRDSTNWGKVIGVLVNAGPTPNVAEYDIEVAQAGLYQLEVRVASLASRPTILKVNGTTVKTDFAAAVTGSWYPDGQKWFVEAFVYLSSGKNLIQLEQPMYFPHIDKLLLVPAPQGARPTSAAQAAASFAEAVGEGVVLVEAESASRGNLVAVSDGYGEGIGILGGPGGANQGEIDVEIPSDGIYQVVMRYAAADARPTKLFVNGVLVNAAAAGQVTGSWFPDTQRWAVEGQIRLGAGNCVVRLQREGPIPHIDKIMFIESTRFQGVPDELRPLGEHQLHLEFVEAWAKYLAKSDSEPLLGRWRSAVESGADLRAVAASFNGPPSKELESLLKDPEGPFKVPETIERYFDSPSQQQLAKLRDEKDKLVQQTPVFPHAMAVSDGTPENIRIHIRGSHLTQGAQVPRGVPQIFNQKNAVGLENSSGRLELAHWIASPENPLTARVIVNRIWQWHFGNGLVRSPDNFGKLGLGPTHPELLDWLAAEFIESGWSIKRLHRTIMLSATYQMSTRFNAEAQAVDPDNKLYWRSNRNRLYAEAVRDSILSVTGQLDLSMGGSILPTDNRAYVTSTANVDPVAYQTNRRSLYLPVVRSALYDVFQAFDFAEPSVSAGQRQTTTVATQALFMMNSDVVSDATKAWAERLLNDARDQGTRIQSAYRSAYGRGPTESEIRRAAGFIQFYTERTAAGGATQEQASQKAWQAFCRVLLSASEFIYVE